MGSLFFPPTLIPRSNATFMFLVTLLTMSSGMLASLRILALKKEASGL